MTHELELCSRSLVAKRVYVQQDILYTLKQLWVPKPAQRFQDLVSGCPIVGDFLKSLRWHWSIPYAGPHRQPGGKQKYPTRRNYQQKNWISCNRINKPLTVQADQRNVTNIYGLQGAIVCSSQPKAQTKYNKFKINPISIMNVLRVPRVLARRTAGQKSVCNRRIPRRANSIAVIRNFVGPQATTELESKVHVALHVK